ncbi:hypothetical protein M231_03649 [Tremella mesenterica]|uniref:2-methylcitrate dehydratase PrpD n=1 Tax=Tremella mesenterica TaxID=5217 RepID=A0A4Q1BMT3_TREME|nr:uncharacterized protein TREMEDRAFT_59420 [Tremella mesenterica DSM 1558]EIW73253.1 hypothetical protein TREMEDRAFT_59420 [Tremella mesenterica DSM 1558]RXK39144.1 hypothetical protein M231_03649 [Tremella mesenterica]
MSSTITTTPLPTPGIQLARYAVSHRTRPLPPNVLLKLKHHLLDTFSAIVSGSALEAGLASQTHLSTLPSSDKCSVIGTFLRTSIVDSAFANGMSAHADESDDSHETSQTHPGCGILPAALSISEYVSASGEDLIKAVGLGYEICIRFGESLSSSLSFSRSSLSCHALGPLFGGGFAAGYLLGFTEEKYLILLNYLAQEASGLTTWRLDKAHTLKSYVFAGMPASNAVKCVMMVNSGFTGTGDVLGEDRNFFDAILPGKNARLDLRDLESWKVLEADLKKYSVGFPIAAPLAALESIIDDIQSSNSNSNRSLKIGQKRKSEAEEGVEKEEKSEGEMWKKVEWVKLWYHPDWYKVIGDANHMPDLNLRHCLAATLVQGRLTFDASHDESLMKEPRIVAVGKTIQLLDDEEQDRFTARVEVKIGDKVWKMEQGGNVLGRYENPMNEEQVIDKAKELLGTVLDEERVKGVVEIVSRLEKEKSLDKLIGFMCPPKI